MFKKLSNMAFGRKIILGAITAVVVAVACFYGWAYSNGKNACTQDTLKGIIEAEKEHGKTKAEVVKLGDPDLDKRLSRWVH